MWFVVGCLLTWDGSLALLTPSSTPKQSLRSLFEKKDQVLADPISKEALVRSSRLLSDSVSVTYSSSTNTFGVKDVYVDLVDPKKPASSSRQEMVQTETFRSPLTAFLYERGWRQNFQRSGFPGIEKEFLEVKSFFDLKEATAVVDLSCGTGLMTRRLDQVVPSTARLFAADFSEAMLRETKRRLDSDRVELVRVDVANLPFADNSIDAIHAGAAMHCWPRLEDGLKEICRVLKKDSNGQFFATTFLQGALGTAVTGNSETNGFRFFTLDELERLALDAGFQDVTVRREGSYCAVLKATTRRV